MNEAAFFDALRRGILGPTLDDGEVQGCRAILAQVANAPLAYAAYAFATAYHETGGKMSPQIENLNYSVAGLIGTFGRHRISVRDAQRLGRVDGRPADQQAIANIIYGGAWGRKHLGNTQPNDGWHFRGVGMDQVTGRTNFSKVAELLGLGNALMANPTVLLDPDYAAEAMVSSMMAGRYRGERFSTHLPRNGPASIAEFTAARGIINADVEKNGLLVARAANQFQNALILAGRQ